MKMLLATIVGAYAVTASAQGMQPRRTLGNRLARPAQTVSQTADAAKDREARKVRAAQRPQFSAGSSTAEFDRECETLFMDIVREAEICQTNLAEYATYPYWPDAMGVVSNFCEKENCVVVDAGHHFGAWRQGCGKKTYVATSDFDRHKRFMPWVRSDEDGGFRLISRGGAYTNVACRHVGPISCYDAEGRFEGLYDSVDKLPRMQDCLNVDVKRNYAEQDRWMVAHGFSDERSGREAELRLDAARTNAIDRLEALRTILSKLPEWKVVNKCCDVSEDMRGPSLYRHPLRRPVGRALGINTNDAVFVKMNERFENLGRNQDRLIEEFVSGLTGLEFGSSVSTNGILDLKFNLGSYESCTFGRAPGSGVVSSVTLLAEFDPPYEQKVVLEKLDRSLSVLLSAIGMDCDALAYEVSLNGTRPLLGLRRPGGSQDWKSVQSLSQRFLISRNRQQSGAYVVTISDQKKVAMPTTGGGLLGGSLRARRSQRQQAAQAEAEKQQETQAARDAERQAQAEREKQQREAERAEQQRQLSLIQEELARVRAQKGAIDAERQSQEAERAEQRRQLMAIQEEKRRIREQKTTLDAERRAQEELKKLAASVRSNKVSATANKISNTPKSVGNVVAEKLQGCDFLHNKDFKKNAKFYLCLFSASWCGPCRREMPRIAKTYAETLKDDPDIELIHFSRDQNDEKALAWAKEHDVKFPVVKPNGGNPLDLHSRGIPHLFIVKADGTLVEEGHPMKVFTEERISRIKENRPLQDKVTTNGVNWVYEVKDDGIILGGGNRNKKAVEKSTSGSVEIPDSIMGRPVRGIGEWAFSDCRGIKSVVIPPSVSRIGGRAFIWSGLNSVTIPANVKSVGCAAFHGCSDLKAVTIQPGVEQLESTAFMWCSSLESVSIPASVTGIGKEAFSYCERLLSFSVDPDNPSYSSNNKMLCTKDGSTLVAGVNGDVTIPPCVSSVGPSAFYGCISLKSVKIPLNVKSIGKYAFFACRELKSVAIPSSVTSIGERAFCWCDRLMGFEVDYDNAFYTAEGDVLYNKMKTELIFWPTGKSGSVTMPPSVTDIRGWAFSHCKGVASVTIPSSVKNIGELAFDGCSALISVTMCGERPESHGDVFRSCEKLKSIHVPANAKSWAGMKEWQGIPLVFDAESKK